MKEFVISDKGQGIRLDKQLMKILNNAGSGFVYKMLRKKNITLNGHKAEGNEHLKAGDIIRIYLADDTFNKFSSDKLNEGNVKGQNKKDFPDIGEITVYEDDKLLLLNKPAGILSQKAEAGDISINELCLDHLIKKNELTADRLKIFKPSVCNRLDRNTSGLIIFAKDYSMAAAVNTALKERTIHKYYLCIAEGRIAEEGRYTGYLTKDREKNRVNVSEAPVPGAAKIETVIRPIKVSQSYSLLEILLVTGRSHQIRAQLAKLGHPLLGDVKYGSTVKQSVYNKQEKRAFQQLHAYKLSIPGDMEGVLGYLAGRDFYAKVPDEMGAVIKKIFGVDINAYMEQQRP